MTLQDAAELAQAHELFPGKIPQAGQDGIISRGSVTLGQDEPVPVEPAGVAGVSAHLAEKERHQNIGGRQRAAQVAGTGPKQHFHDVEANLAGDLLQVVVVRDGVYLLVSSFVVQQFIKFANALFAPRRLLPPHPDPLPPLRGERVRVRGADQPQYFLMGQCLESLKERHASPRIGPPKY